MPGQTSTAPTRLLWVDVAKGACIVLVVLHHAVVKDLALQAPPGMAPVVSAWVEVTTALKPVRMPLFFLLSGFVAAGAVRRPWPAARRRVLSPAYLYVVWLLLHGAFFSVERLLPMNRTQDLPELAGDLLWASTNLWFLYALAVYFLVARLVSGLPRTPVLAVAALVSGAAWLVPTEDWNRVSVVAHVVFFLVGVLAPDLVRRLATLPRRTTARLAATYVVLVAGSALLGVPWTVTLVVAGAVGVPLGVAACVRLARSSLAPALAWVGRRTLPVYVLHLPVLAVVLHLPNALGVASWQSGGPGLLGALAVVEVAVHPLLLTAVAVVVALAVQQVLRALGAGALLELPRRTAPARLAARAVAGPEDPAGCSGDGGGEVVDRGLADRLGTVARRRSR